MSNKGSLSVSLQPRQDNQSTRAGGCLAVKRALQKEQRVKKNLRLNYEYYQYFVCSQLVPAWTLLLLRSIIGATCTSVFVFVAVSSNTRALNSSSASTTTTVGFIAANATLTTRKSQFFLCHLTVWSYLVLTLYFICALVNTISVCIRNKSSSSSTGFSLTSRGYWTADRLSAICHDTGLENASDSTAVRQLQGFRLQWLLHTVASDAALLVSVSYFSLLYNSKSGSIAGTDLLQHGINSVFVLVEFVFGGVPVRLINIVYMLCYAILYALFSLFYWIYDNTNVIYPVLDWNKPGLTVSVICGLIFGGVPLVHTFWWSLHLLRCCFGEALLKRDTKCSPSAMKEQA